MKTIHLPIVLLFLICSCSCDKGKSEPQPIVCTRHVAVTDVSGNVYTSIVIGTQEWLVENLKVTEYRDGTQIPNVTSSVGWRALTQGSWANYNNDPGLDAVYGKLYNWYAVSDSRGLTPTGWHVPSDVEWTTLIDYLGGPSVAGGKLKEFGLSHWLTDNNGTITDTRCFNALPGGSRQDDANATFENVSSSGYWWTTEDLGAPGATYVILSHNTPQAQLDVANKTVGFSVRCLKD